VRNIRNRPVPATRAASTYSWMRTERVAVSAIRQRGGTKMIDVAIMALVSPGPNEAPTAMASRIATSSSVMTSADIAHMSDAVRAMARESGANLDQLAEGWMHVANLGFSAADSQQIVAAGMRAATAAGTDASDTINVLASAMKEFNLPAAAAALIAITATGSFRRWERFMYLCVAANFVAIPLALMSHPHIGPVVHDTLIPGVKGGLDSTAMLLIIGIVGTTVAPWQLFFQQSNVIDKRLTPRWMAYERADTAIGAVVVVLGAAALMIATAFAFGGTKYAGGFEDAHAVANGLAHTVGPLEGDLLAIALLNAAIIGAAAVTLSTSYAFGDVFGIRHSLHRSWKDARAFYGSYGALVLVAAGIVLIPNAPLGLMTLAVQALAGVLLPSATVFLLLLCNDRAVLGPWVNRPWLNVVASAIVGVLVMLSLILAATTLFPSLDVRSMAEALGALLVVALLMVGLVHLRRGRTIDTPATSAADRLTWQMPPLANLPRPVWSTTRKAGMIALRGYLLVAALLMVVKVVQLAVGGHA